MSVRTKRAKRSTVYSYKKKYYIHRLWREFKPTVRNLSMKADSGCSFSFARVLKRYLVSVVLQCNQSKGSKKKLLQTYKAMEVNRMPDITIIIDF